MKILLSLALATGLAVPLLTLAADPPAHNMATHPAHHMSAADALSDGTVKKLDLSAGTVTLAHGPIENLGMPPMTMSFSVKDTAMLGGLNVGTKVRFQAEQAGETIRITRLEPAN